jgi:chaperonin GroES
MKLKPLGDNILIKPKTEQKTPSGILIPDTAKEKPQEGEVVAVGPGKLEDGKRVKPEVKKGDRVLYKKWGGNEIKLEGEEYLIVGSEDILGILK